MHLPPRGCAGSIPSGLYTSKWRHIAEEDAMSRHSDYSVELAWTTLFLFIPVGIAVVGALLFGDNEGFMREQARKIAAAKEAEALQGPVLPASYEYDL